MRWWGFASVLAAVIVPSVASAQDAELTTDTVESPADTSASTQVIGYGAMPGGLYAPSALSLSKHTVQVALLGGYGLRNDLIGVDTSLARTIGRVAIAFAPADVLTIGLSFDGRYDKHTGGEVGYVGDPHLLIRAAKAQGTIAFGGQLDLWVPGRDAPSIATAAISGSLQGIVTLPAGPGLLSFNAGFRLDNSAKSASDPTRYVIQDRVSLGVSEFNAVVGGAHLSIPVNPQMYVAAEGEVDVFIGSGDTPVGATEAHAAPSPLVRFGVNAGYRITKTWTALAYLAGSRIPKITALDVSMNDVRLVPYEATWSFGVGVQGRFGGTGAGATVRAKPIAISAPIFAQLAGEVFDDAGKPVVGAKVEIKTKTREATAVTDETGRWVIEKITIGARQEGNDTLEDPLVEVSVSVSGKEPGRTTLSLKEGVNTADKLTLDSILPPGQLRAVVRGAGTGKPIAGATITIEPGGQTATSGADGTFQIDLPPGDYKITVSSSGRKNQELDVTIDPNGVAIKNIELR